MKLVFDLEYCQPVYNFADVIIGTEYKRLQSGDDHIDVEFLYGKTNRFGYYKNWPKTQKDCEMCLREVAEPMSWMLPSVRSVTRVVRPANYDGAFEGFLNYFSDAYQSGIRPLCSNMKRSKLSSLVSITLRECEHWPKRNSRVEEWCEVAKILGKAGYQVTVLRDTSMARETLPGVFTNTEASTNLKARAFLYAHAACNMFVSNGPAWFALAMDAPVLMFRPSCEEANKSARLEALKLNGIEKGKQIPGAPSYQRLAWREDFCSEIIDEFAQYVDRPVSDFR